MPRLRLDAYDVVQSAVEQGLAQSVQVKPINKQRMNACTRATTHSYFISHAPIKTRSACPMAYNAIAQGRHDAFSDSNSSPTSSSPLDDYQYIASRPNSPDLDYSSQYSDPMDRPRTVSREGSVLRHPTPDLQSSQGAYIGNIARLEQSAERLSLSSDNGEELRKMKMEQRRPDSRHSSILGSHIEEEGQSSMLQRQLSYGYGSHTSNSIIGTNNVARSGGFSPAAYFASPRSSVRSRSWSHHNSVNERSTSQGPRLTQVSEPEQEGKPLDSPISSRLVAIAPQLEAPVNGLRVISDEEYNLDSVEIPHTQLEEPETVATTVKPRPSTDTFRQATTLFADFDGVHVGQHPQAPVDAETPVNQRASSLLPVSTRPISYVEPTAGDNMVYYPAPVPMMLNLPKRLSKSPAAPQRDKRRSEMLDDLPEEVRKSTAWLPDTLANLDEGSRIEQTDIHLKERKRRTMAEMPSQLRASMFFDYPSSRQDVEVKGDSAVATLDSILDASAFAPVSAFTDHPIAGRVGPEVYGKAPAISRASGVPEDMQDVSKRRSAVNLSTKRNSNPNLLETMKKRNSSLMSLGTHFGKKKSSAQQFEDAEEYLEVDAAKMDGEEAPLRPPRLDGEDAAEESDLHDAPDVTAEQDEQMEEQEEVNNFNGQPTTLLAELQLRKQQQKQRNRQAATAFPNGMHSTLLQLDAVAQVQKDSRRQKHTMLAWEDPDAHLPGIENENDEDVPLGVLFPGHKTIGTARSRNIDEDRPLGLIARRDLEDNEPLSHRRARLKGEEPLLDKHNGMHTLDLPRISEGKININSEPEIDYEGETLAQRIKRLKATKVPAQPRPVSGDFASEVLSQLGGLSPSQQPAEKEEADPRTTTRTPDIEETLGQRRKRLQKEGNKIRNVSDNSNNTQIRPPNNKRHTMASVLSAHPAAGAGTRSLSSEIIFAPAPKTRNTPWAINQTRKASMGPMRGLHLASGLGGLDGGFEDAYSNGAGNHPHPLMQQPPEVDAKQRDMIDRWRQSVHY